MSSLGSGGTAFIQTGVKMWYDDYHKATSYKFGIVSPTEYRLFTMKHGCYLVVHSKKCKQCRKLPLRQRWTGTRVCVCGNPYIHIVRDNEHYNKIREWKNRC